MNCRVLVLRALSWGLSKSSWELVRILGVAGNSESEKEEERQERAAADSRRSMTALIAIGSYVCCGTRLSN